MKMISNASTKTPHILFLAFILLQLSVSACAGMLGQDQEKGAREYAAGTAYLAAGKPDAALRHFKAAVYSDRRLAQAYFEIGKIYRAKDSIESRQRADAAFKKAVLHDPGNVSYTMALAQLHLDRNLVSSAEKAFEKVVQMDSTSAEAWYQLGRIREDEYLYYANMVNGDTSGASIHFDSFANADKKRAIRFYEQAIRQNPDFLEAYYRLGFLYYESSNWLAMMAIFEDAVSRMPLEKNAHLYLALSYYRLGEMARADRRYKMAWELMAENERAVYTTIWPLNASDRKEVPSGGSNTETAFWQKRDPLFLTDYNERQLEHFARIAYANLRFSDPRREVVGWDTDRGKVYIRYGMPVSKLKRGAWLSDTRLNGGSPLVGSTETWIYRGFDFVFEDAFLTREYRFKWGMGANDDYKDIYRRMIKSVPETYASPYRRNAFDFPVITRQFMKPDGATVVYFYSGLAKEVVGMDRARSRPPGAVSIQRGLFLFDQNWQQISKSVTGLTLRPDRTDWAREHLSVLDSVTATAGAYHFALEFLQASSQKVGSYRDSLVIRDFPSHALSLSDLILADRIRLRTGIADIRRQQIVVSPSFDAAFKPGQDLHLYYEIYHLGLDNAGSSNYTISHTVRQVQARRSTVSKFLRFLARKNDKKAAVVSQFDYQGDRRNENHYRILQLRSYDPGHYELEVRVRDRVRNLSGSQAILFQIIAGEP